MSIKDIAMRVLGMPAVEADTRTGEQILSDFAESLVAELAKENEPVAWYDGNKFYANEESASMACADMANLKPVFTSPPSTADIEQQVAEACRKMAVSWGNARLDDNGGHALRNFATAVEIEEWREYL